MLAKVPNDFSPPIRKDSCRLSSCVNVCLHYVIANRHSVLSCRRSLTAPMIAPDSCAWQRLSQHSLLACAVRRKRLVSLNARKSCDSWLKTFWSARIPSPFVTAFRFLQVRPKTEDPTTQTVKITFCVSGVEAPPLGNFHADFFSEDSCLREGDRKTYSCIQQDVVIGILPKITPENVGIQPQFPEEGFGHSALIEISASRPDRQSQYRRAGGIEQRRAREKEILDSGRLEDTIVRNMKQ